jgi:hypothetical protein
MVNSKTAFRYVVFASNESRIKYVHGQEKKIKYWYGN